MGRAILKTATDIPMIIVWGNSEISSMAKGWTSAIERTVSVSWGAKYRDVWGLFFLLLIISVVFFFLEPARIERG